MRHPLILESKLTKEPRYYVSQAWRVRELDNGSGMTSVEVTGKKYDITDQIEKIVKDRCKKEHL